MIEMQPIENRHRQSYKMNNIFLSFHSKCNRKEVKTNKKIENLNKRKEK